MAIEAQRSIDVEAAWYTNPAKLYETQIPLFSRNYSELPVLIFIFVQRSQPSTNAA
jgi:hypothetical protein